MTDKIIFHLRNPRNAGMALRTVQSRLGTKTLHQTVLSKTREFSRSEHGENYQNIAMMFATNPANIGNIVKAEGANEEQINKAIGMMRNSGATVPALERLDATPKEAIKGVQTSSGKTRKSLTKGLNNDGQLDTDETNESYVPQ